MHHGEWASGATASRAIVRASFNDNEVLAPLDLDLVY